MSESDDARSQASTTSGIGSDYTASNSSVRSELASDSVSSYPMSPGGGGKRSKRRGVKRSNRH